jgi:dTDP-4-amino-4,6-dideoxygalactose transaminase
VITTPVTFVATVAAIAHTGATPVLVDVDPRSLTMDVQAAEAALTPRTRALLPVHLYGHPADMDGLTAVATRAGAAVLEDAAQSAGSRYRGRRTGSLGDAAAFSFFPTKNLGCYGDGGAILSSRRELVETALQLRQHGFDGDVSVRLGFNSRLDTVQAAVLRVKLRALDDQLRRRAAVADRYGEQLAGTELVPPSVAEGCVHSYYQYSVLVPAGRDEAVAFLRDHGVEARTYYSSPLHLQPALRHLGYRPGQFPHAEAYAARGMCLPCRPGMGEEQLEYVGTLLRQRFGGGR